MWYLLFIAVALLLFFGFVGLTTFETRRGVRLFVPLRESLDRFSARLSYVLTHFDLAAFSLRVLRDLFERVTHDVAHGSLVAVRFIERTLTRAVRYLRERNGHAAPVAPRETSHFVRTIIYFKRTLRRSRRTDAPVAPPAEDRVE